MRLVLITLLSWLSMLGFDFFLNAGLLARLYLEPGPFLLPPAEAFRRIPIGYLSFLLTAVLLVWLMSRLGTKGWRGGFGFGLKLGGLASGSTVIALLSITTASIGLLAGWFIGMTLQVAVAGAVAGSGLAGQSLRRLFLKVIAVVLSLAVATIALQTLGLAAAVRI